MLGTVRKAEQAPERLVTPAPIPGHVARRELLHQISNFLLDCELAVSPANLAIAQEFLSGSNPALCRQILARQLAQEPVTQAWLDDVVSDAEQAATMRAAAALREALAPLVAGLEQSLDQFAQNAREALAITSEYRAALDDTAASLEAARPLVELPTLTTLTRTMLERSRSVEAEMQRRAGEAAGWRETVQVTSADTAMDHLTGVSNSRAFDVVLEQEYRAGRAAGEPLTIAFCAIDQFQAITDSHGRATGDRLLQALARGLKRISAHSCHVTRDGGEQFVLLFRGISPDQARQQLDEAREQFARRKLINRETEIPIGTVTFSGGVADVFAYGNPRAALNGADAALGQAREQGRNRIVMAGKPA